jgi:hypothetical protein
MVSWTIGLNEAPSIHRTQALLQGKVFLRDQQDCSGPMEYVPTLEL